jgi:NDP-sugar pyrophosphorylase family protein
MNVDILCDAAMGPLAAAFEASGAIAGLVAQLTPTRGTVMFEQATMAYRGVPTERAIEAGEGWADFIGLAFYRRDFLQLVPAGCWWRDIGTPAALAAVHRELLEGRCGLQPAPGMAIDRERLIGAPAGTPAACLAGLGPHAWVETPVPRGCRIANTVVFRGARLLPGSTIRDKLVTPWGTLPLEA